MNFTILSSEGIGTTWKTWFPIQWFPKFPPANCSTSHHKYYLRYAVSPTETLVAVANLCLLKSDLHQGTNVHGDICPEAIEFTDPFCLSTVEFRNTMSNTTVSRVSKSKRSIVHDFIWMQVVLSSTNICLAFYGDLGLRERFTGTDQYRAPELVYGMNRAWVDVRQI